MASPYPGRYTRRGPPRGPIGSLKEDGRAPWTKRKNDFAGWWNLSPEGILITHDLRVVFANAAAARLFGASAPDHLVNSAFLDLLHPGSRAPLREQLGRLRSGRTLAPTDERILRVDGKALSVEITAAALDDRNVPEIQVILRDASERKRAERALRESEERHMLAFAGAQEGVWDWNLETGAVVYSARWKEMLGYSDDEIEPHVRAWERLLHPDDSRAPTRLNESVARGGADLRRGVPPAPQGRSLRPRALARLSGAARARRAGRPHRRHASRLTERKRAEAALRESEERLTLAFAGAQEGVWDWNLETGAVVYSPRWKQMLGYAEDEIEPHISAWERLLHPDDVARAREVNESVTRRRTTYEGEFRLRHKDGHYVHVLSRGFPVRREPGGPVVRIVGTHFDLTERNGRGRAAPHTDSRAAQRNATRATDAC